ncbi:hypothetical protein S7711_08886 [Stachybotrys chartarum IBT 7711]|uniref:BZIP domain-containing protein n=1 Tax=Stachybotrys chartarum (strain CBS 109288 / IBT 7711) TaxID=1280523 RepID=A0A084AL89_STACB|nr:hypothetical protein S7711_08886 [Stachybotrys chartarum IBT 7711]KFA80961.1 hypothetical protein S40288_00838 [Stachybotrys chartarum IBT 40288]
MEISVTPLHAAPGGGEADAIPAYPNRIDAEAEAEAKANKQRRKVQNRKNQRAHRESFPKCLTSKLIGFEGLRNRVQDLGSIQTSRPFQVRRWRLDEPDDSPTQDASAVSIGAAATNVSYQTPRTRVSASVSTQDRASVVRGASSTNSGCAQAGLTTPFFFPLSTDHLLHLIQYNVFRAFVSNKRTLNILLTGWTGPPPSPTTCPVSGPYRDDTAVFPLNPNIPFSLAPTRLQQSQLHSIWINLFPFPRVRDNFIRREGSFDHWELLQDLIGELMAITPAPERRDTHQTFTISDPKPKWTLPLKSGRDEDEVTAGRKGLIVWGEPYDMRSWEVTPGFVSKWSWALEGCDDLIEFSNRWRLMRGEEPMTII